MKATNASRTTASTPSRDAELAQAVAQDKAVKLAQELNTTYVAGDNVLVQLQTINKTVDDLYLSTETMISQASQRLQKRSMELREAVQKIREDFEGLSTMILAAVKAKPAIEPARKTKKKTARRGRA